MASPTPPAPSLDYMSDPARQWSSNNPFAPLSTNPPSIPDSVTSAWLADEELKREELEERLQAEDTVSEVIKMEDLVSGMKAEAGEIPLARDLGQPIHFAAEVEADVVRRELADLQARKESLEQILEARGVSSPVASISARVKVLAPDKWKGKGEYAEREAWIETAEGYLASIGLDLLATLDKSLTPYPFHIIHSLFSSDAPIASTSHAILPPSAPSSPRGLLSDSKEGWRCLAPDHLRRPHLAGHELNANRDDYFPHTLPRDYFVNDIPLDLAERDLDPLVAQPVEPLPNLWSLEAMYRADVEKAKGRMKREEGKGKKIRTERELLANTKPSVGGGGGQRGGQIKTTTRMLAEVDACLPLKREEGKGKKIKTERELLANTKRWLNPDEAFPGEQADGSSSDDEPAVGFMAIAIPAICTERERRRRRRAE
ncbi:hypothetical protein JCM1840_007241, partial [Sporobolomyces johnsonii]